MKTVYIPCAFAATLFAFWLFRLIEVNTPPNFVEMHDVWIVRRSSPQNFRALVRNPGSAEWIEFTVNACPDFEPTREIQAGVTLRLLQYVEDRTRSCMELDGKYAGYSLMRDDHDRPIITSAPRPSSAPTRSNETDRPEQARSERP